MTDFYTHTDHNVNVSRCTSSISFTSNPFPENSLCLPKRMEFLEPDNKLQESIIVHDTKDNFCVFTTLPHFRQDLIFCERLKDTNTGLPFISSACLLIL
jgi:hypothetical protein